MIFISVYVLGACTDTLIVPQIEVKKEIFVLFAPNALGDNGYNDQIYRGVVRYMNEDKFADAIIDYYNPTSLEEGEQIIKRWKSKDPDGKKQLLVLPGSEYKNVLDEQLQEKPLDTLFQQILLFENHPVDLPGVATFHISMYGASYIAGAIAGKMRFLPLIVLANSSDSNLIAASDGFKDGYADCSDEDNKQTDLVYLSDASSGYAMADSVYIKMHEWVQTYDFIFPVMGGSNMGVFRYIRQYPKGVYTVGMDVDQSYLCNQIIGSVIKDIDVVIKEYLDRWSSDEIVPKHAIYGLQSGYIRFQVSENYGEAFAGMAEEAHKLALIKEDEYEKK